MSKYDPVVLNEQLNIAGRHPDLPVQLQRWRDMSKATREELRCQLDVSYGPGVLEKFDFFPSRVGDAACVLFIHGGYWRSLDKEVFSFIARGFVNDGPAVAVMNYPLAPAHTLDDIVASTRRAVLWLHDNAAELGIDPRRIAVCGHSSGGHLATMLMLTDWSRFQRAEPPFARSCSIGGIYDLEAVRHSDVNRDVRLTEEISLRNTPLRLLRKIERPFVLAIAQNEADEFQRQHQELATAWQSVGQEMHVIELQGDDHFSVIDSLIEPNSPLNSLLRL